MALQHLRSSTADKRPTPGAMADGQLAMNTNLASPGLFFKDSNGDLVKAGPVHVGTTAPNVSPASGGQAGNSKGELWLDTTGSDYTLKTWDGSAWREIVVTSAMIKDGTIVNADINASAAIAGTKVSPDFGSQNVVTTGTATAASLIPTGSVAPVNGVYLPAANTVAVTTNSTDRLYIDSSGNIGAGTTVPSTLGGGGQLVLQKTGGSRLVIASNTRRFYINGASGSDDLRIGRRISSDTADDDILTIDGTGRVGLGTSTFLGGTKAVIAQDVDANYSTTFTNGTTKAQLLLRDVSDTTTLSSPFCTLLFGAGNQGGAFATVTGIRESSQSSALAFGTASASANPVERLRIDSSGRVGIGTTSPAFGSGSGLEIERLDAIATLRIERAGTSPSALELRAQAAECVLESRNATPLIFGVNTSERARIDTSGRLLVGTSTARSAFYNAAGSTAAALQVEGNDNSTAALSVVANTSANANAPHLIFGKSAGTAVGSNTLVGANVNLGRIAFQGNDGTEFVQAAEIRADVDGTPGANDMPGRLVFSTTADNASTPTERMRIGNVGNHICRGDSGTNVLTVRSGSAAGTTIALIRATNSSTDPSVDGTGVFIVYTNGNVLNTNNSYGSLSDIKLKENIVDANSQWDDLKALQVRKYNFKEGQTHTQIGLIAQEVELVSPGLVSESPDHDEDGNDLGTVTKSVNYSVLYMKAVKALQEAMERIETLEADVAALKAQ
jgi:hypothetical protein